jgi:hypothetical protein
MTSIGPDAHDKIMGLQRWKRRALIVVTLPLTIIGGFAIELYLGVRSGLRMGWLSARCNIDAAREYWR